MKQKVNFEMNENLINPICEISKKMPIIIIKY